MFNSFYFKLNYINTHVINKLQFLYQRLGKNDKFMECVLYKSYHSSPRSISKITNSRNTVQQLKVDRKYLCTNTNIQNNVILFKWETNYFKKIKWFVSFGLLCSGVIFYTSYDPKLISLLSEDVTWRKYFFDFGPNLIFVIFGMLLGPGITSILYVASRRFIKYLILNKGGQRVTVVTYNLFKGEEVLSLPLNQIQTSMARDKMKSYLPVKIKGRKFFFLLDHSGTFFNENLFDYTIGIEKKW